MKKLRHVRQLVSFMQTPRSSRQLVFYSESANYWPHLGGLVREVLAAIEGPICYISSDGEDPGLKLEHPNLFRFSTDTGAVRNWLFANIDADVVVMTMPDLHKYQVKRSRHPVHYVYVQHSLVSLHMIYRPGAFDHYDTVFCAGPHHISEIRAMEGVYDRPAKNLVRHGYGRLDAILAEVIRRALPPKDPGAATHVLIAPSWGPSGIIETIGDQVVELLLQNGFKVTLRPHPQTRKFAMMKLDHIVRRHAGNRMFECELDIAQQESLHHSDLMISDWSGAALDYAFGLAKPVIFIDVPRKINNRDYQKLNLIPFEVSVRQKIGCVISLDDLETLPSIVKAFAAPPNALEETRQNNVFNVGSSDKAGAAALLKLVADAAMRRRQRANKR